MEMEMEMKSFIHLLILFIISLTKVHQAAYIMRVDCRMKIKCNRK